MVCAPLITTARMSAADGSNPSWQLAVPDG
jgi:hypothetical protein